MHPAALRDQVFDRLSVQTMRYVEATPTGTATRLTGQVYAMVREEFFINGSITSHSAVPDLMAAMWCGGREAVLVEDRLERARKEAISAVLSQINDCPYCEDMLVSLVYAAGDDQLAGQVSDKEPPGSWARWPIHCSGGPRRWRRGIGTRRFRSGPRPAPKQSVRWWPWRPIRSRKPRSGRSSRRAVRQSWSGCLRGLRSPVPAGLEQKLRQPGANEAVRNPRRPHPPGR